MKRILTILCALALSVIVCFAACADDKNPGSGNGGGGNTEQSGGGGDGWTDNY